MSSDATADEAAVHGYWVKRRSQTHNRDYYYHVFSGAQRWSEPGDYLKTAEHPGQARFSHILCKFAKVGAKAPFDRRHKRTVTRKRDEAQGILETCVQQLLDGTKTFAILADEHSECPSGDQGGDLGWVSPGQIYPEFDTPAFALNPGELSAIVETPSGLHTILCTNRGPQTA